MSQEYKGSPTLILGTGAFAAELAEVILAQPEAGYELIGVVSAQAGSGGGWFHGVPMLGSADELNSIVTRTAADPPSEIGRLSEAALKVRRGRPALCLLRGFVADG